MKLKICTLAVALVFFLFLILPVSAQFQLEANLGLNLFDIIGTKSSAELDLSNVYTGDTDLKGDLNSKIPTAALIGVCFGYSLNPTMIIGGEFGFFKTTAEGKESTLESSDYSYTIDKGDADLQVLRIGPVFRYYFASAKLRPYINVGVAYTSLKIDIQDVSESVKEGLLDISAGGGVVYFVSPMIYLGGYARADYYLNIIPSEIKDPENVGVDTPLNTKTSWLPVSVIFQVGFVF